MRVGGKLMKNWRISCIQLRERPGWTAGVLAGLTVVLALASLCLGAVELHPSQVFQALWRPNPQDVATQVVLYSRLPHTCGSLLAGSALAVAGVIIQTVLANPLAAPHIIGVNSGAALGVTLCCALAPATSLQPLAAFAGAMVGVLLVLLFAEATGASRITLVLAGVAISSIFSAMIDAVITFYPDALVGYSDFRMGGLSGVTMARLAPAAVLIGVSLAIVLGMTGLMDILALGPETAQSLGVSVRPVRLIFLTLAAALAGAAVSFCGLVGFVGLLVPHGVRAVVGEDSRPLVLCSALGGASLMTLCDLLARMIAAPFELPVGTILSVVGGPFFLYLLIRQRGGRTHD